MPQEIRSTLRSRARTQWIFAFRGPIDSCSRRLCLARSPMRIRLPRRRGVSAGVYFICSAATNIPFSTFLTEAGFSQSPNSLKEVAPVRPWKAFSGEL